LGAGFSQEAKEGGGKSLSIGQGGEEGEEVKEEEEEEEEDFYSQKLISSTRSVA